MPKPRQNVKGDTKAFNEACLELGPEKMVETGQLSIKDYEKVRKAITLYKLHTAKLEDTKELKNVWYWGPPGVGKSKRAREENPSLFVKPLNKWWDGYSGETAVLLDDVGQEHTFLSYFLKIWGDHYPF